MRHAVALHRTHFEGARHLGTVELTGVHPSLERAEGERGLVGDVLAPPRRRDGEGLGDRALPAGAAAVRVLGAVLPLGAPRPRAGGVLAVDLALAVHGAGLAPPS